MGGGSNLRKFLTSKKKTPHTHTYEKGIGGFSIYCFSMVEIYFCHCNSAFILYCFCLVVRLFVLLFDYLINVLNKKKKKYCLSIRTNRRGVFNHVHVQWSQLRILCTYTIYTTKRIGLRLARTTEKWQVLNFDFISDKYVASV